MAVPCVPPIVSPMHYDAAFKVDVLLHQPLLARGVTSADIRLEMMSLCSQLETLCKKEAHEHSYSGNEHGHMSNSFLDRATIVCDRVVQLIDRSADGSLDCMAYIKSHGLHRLFPRATSYFENQHVIVSEEKTCFDSYFSSLSSLSHLSTLARQMHSDCADTSSQKYIAHQLAILYQLLTNLKSKTFSQHKQSIEENFKTIKSTLSGREGDTHKPCLTTEQQEWLLNLTSSIITTIGTFPLELTQDMFTPASILLQRP